MRSLSILCGHAPVISCECDVAAIYCQPVGRYLNLCLTCLPYQTLPVTTSAIPDRSLFANDEWVALTYPPPVPDYTPEEMRVLFAQEMKRARKTGDLPRWVTVTTLRSDHFHPGTSIMNGREIGSMWVVAFWHGFAFRFEREELGGEWRLTGSPYIPMGEV